MVFWSDVSHASEYDVADADDVHDAISWADAEARTRGCSYTLYAKVETPTPGLVRLAGINPTIHSPPSFDRSHPLG